VRLNSNLATKEEMFEHFKDQEIIQDEHIPNLFIFPNIKDFHLDEFYKSGKIVLQVTFNNHSQLSG
jgi:hypothetical protein